MAPRIASSSTSLPTTLRRPRPMGPSVRSYVVSVHRTDRCEDQHVVLGKGAATPSSCTVTATTTMAFQPKPFSEVTKSAIASSFVPGVTLPANRHQGTLQKASLAQQVGDTFDDILDSLCDLEGDDEVELRVEMGDSGMDNEVVLGGMDDESDSGYESDDSQSPYISSDCSHRACFQGSSVCRVKGKASQREGSHLPAVKDLDMIDAEAKRAVTPDKPTDVQVDDMEWEST